MCTTRRNLQPPLLALLGGHTMAAAGATKRTWELEPVLSCAAVGTVTGARTRKDAPPSPSSFPFSSPCFFLARPAGRGHRKWSLQSPAPAGQSRMEGGPGAQRVNTPPRRCRSSSNVRQVTRLLLLAWLSESLVVLRVCDAKLAPASRRT